jgi:hypothetical protein
MGIADWDWSGDDDTPIWERVLVGLRDGAFLGAEGGVRRRGLVSVNVGWLARGGLLRLYHDRLEFEPNPLERLLRARRRVIPFGAIESIERRPPRRGDLDPLGQTPRMRLHMRDGRPLDVLPASDTLDSWLADLRESYAWWFRRARRDAPVAATTLGDAA